MMNFVQDWGLPIFNMFNVDTFIDIFTLIMLESKTYVVSIAENVLEMPPKESNVGRTTRNTRNISAKRANDTFEERDAQLEVERTRQRVSRSKIDLFKASFNYDQEYDHSVHRDVVIGSMTTILRCLNIFWKTFG